jgi:hypothetical protein
LSDARQIAVIEPNQLVANKLYLVLHSDLIAPKTLTRGQHKLLEQLAEIEDVDFQDVSFMDKVRNIFG